MRALQVPPDPSTVFVDAKQSFGRTALRAIPLIALTVAVITVIAVFAIHEYRSARATELDAMTPELRSVTPGGTHEKSVKGFGGCGLGYSEQPTVTRVLSVDRDASSASALSEIARHFRDRGWGPSTRAVPGGFTLEQNGRALAATRDPSHVYLTLYAVRLIC